jgi:hypothetical protein
VRTSIDSTLMSLHPGDTQLKTSRLFGSGWGCRASRARHLAQGRSLKFLSAEPVISPFGKSSFDSSKLGARQKGGEIQRDGYPES